MKSYRPIEIANTFIEIAKVHGTKVSPIKMLMLIYYAHGWHLALYDSPLLDETIVASDDGPIIDSLYHELKHYGNRDIDYRVYSFNSHTGHASAKDIHQDDARTAALLERIWEVFGAYSADHLSKLAHADGTPWSQVYEQEGRNLLRAQNIDNQLIKNYFQQLLKTQTGTKD
jgi:uncharacterized phage-associated protein